MDTDGDTPARHALDIALQNATPETNQFWAMRAIALQCYGRLEQNLCALFGELAGVNPDTAAVIFFRINNSVARSAIIERLFKNKLKTEYNLFRNSFINALRPIDLDRNVIVHWNVVDRATKLPDGTLTSSLRLERPTIWESSADIEPWDYARLKLFGDKCLFYSEIIGLFTLLVLQRATFALTSAAWHDAWRGIFLQPITYPPPADHPSRQIHKIPDSRPPPSPA